MYTIKTLQDLDNIRSCGTYPSTMTDHVELFFRQLLDSLEDDEIGLEHYQLQLLEAGENLLDSLCKNRQQKANMIPPLHLEYVEMYRLSDNCEMYKAVFMPDNESMITVFAEKRGLEPETGKWLRSRCRLDGNELIIQKLKETFEQKSGNFSVTNTIDHVWVMAAAAKPFATDGAAEQFLPSALEQNNHWRSQPHQPTHFVRVILRTTSPQGMNPYVDGTDFCMIVDEQKQTADFFMEDECFEDTPKCHGSEIASAMSWLSQMSEKPLLVQLNDPFLTEEQLQHLTFHILQ